MDFRYAARQLRRAPAFTIVAVLTLGLGIAVTTTFFTIVNALLFKPLPAGRVDGMDVVSLRDARSLRPVPIPFAAFEALQDGLPEPTSRTAAVGSYPQAMVQVPGRAEQMAIEAVSGDYAAILDLPPQLGRWIARADDLAASAAPVVVISDAMWRDWFAADRGAIGRATLRLNGTPCRVIGVAPPGYRGLRTAFAGVDVWLPITQFPVVSPQFGQRYLDGGAFTVLARARPGAPREAVRGSLQGRILAALPERAPGSTTLVLTPLSETLRVRQVGQLATIVMTLASLILLTACANLANMVYARGASRAGETAVRMSLGASSGRILRLALAETTLLAGAAAAVGLSLALAGSALLGAAIPRIQFDRYLRLSLDLSPDYRVFLAAFGAGVFAALTVGFGTAWRASRILPVRALAPSGVSAAMTGREGRTRAVLVSIQVTTALLLVMATGLVWESFRASARRDSLLGYQVHFNTTEVVTGRIDVALHDYHETAGRAFYERVVAAVRALDGVEAAGLADAIPGSRSPRARYTMFEPVTGLPPAGMPQRVRAEFARITPGFLDAIQLPIRRGRDVASSDVDGAPQVAVISHSMADALWPGVDPLGREFRFAGGADPFTIAGITDDPVSSADASALRPSTFVFLPMAQEYRPAALIVARSATPMALYDPIRQAVRALDEEVAISELSTVEDSAMAWLQPYRMVLTVMTTMGAAALGIAMLGVYGVVAYFVSRRMREFGIRLALGATPRRVRKIVFDHTVHIMLVGLLPGVWLAASGSRWLESRQFDLMPNEISTWVVIPLLVLASGVAAGAIPAWRASRVDPNVALREL
jgi:predicted permease